MYRFWLFVCYCFLCWPNLSKAQSPTGLNSNPFPITERATVSQPTLPPSVSLQPRLSTSSPVWDLSVMSAHEPRVTGRPLVWACRGVMTGSQALGVLAHTLSCL